MESGWGEGHANVLNTHEEDGERLGQWLSTQWKRWQSRGWSEEERKAKRAGALGDEEVARLEAVGVAWRGTWLRRGGRGTTRCCGRLWSGRGTPTCRKGTRRTESGWGSGCRRSGSGGGRLGGWSEEERKVKKVSALRATRRWRGWRRWGWCGSRGARAPRDRFKHAFY